MGKTSIPFSPGPPHLYLSEKCKKRATEKSEKVEKAGKVKSGKAGKVKSEKVGKVASAAWLCRLTPVIRKITVTQ